MSDDDDHAVAFDEEEMCRESIMRATRTLIRLGNDIDLARDAVGDALVSVLPMYRLGLVRNFTNYLTTAARNRLPKLSRRSVVSFDDPRTSNEVDRKTLENALAGKGALPTAEAKMQQEQRKAIVIEALNRLNNRYAIFLAYDAEGHSLAEIQELMGFTSLNATTVTKSRAIKALRKAVRIVLAEREAAALSACSK